MADDGRSRTRRTVALAVAAWLGVVVVASAVAWFAIGRAGSEVLDPTAQRVPTTSGTATSAPPASPATTTSPAPGTTTPPPPATTAPPAAAPVDEVATATGGQAGFRCTGASLTLLFAQPATGWSVESSSSDDGLRVEFEADGQRTRVEATCVDGRPSVSVETDSSGSGDDDD